MKSFILALILPATTAALAGGVDQYNIVWDSPSKDAHGSMPLGNGDIGLNAWIEPSGDLIFYISKTDAWDDNGRLLKVGKVRVTLSPAPPVAPFRQELSLQDASMNVRYGDGTALRLWVDANHPVIHVDVTGNHTATAAIELWRTEKYTLPSIECSDVNTGRNVPTVVEPDTILAGQTGRIGWYHRNVKSVGPKEHAEVQGMVGYRREDPLLHRTFGAIITAPDAKRIDDSHLQSQRGFEICVLTRHPATTEQWLADIEQLIGKSDFDAHKNWWASFWNRSWIRATGAKTDRAAGASDDAVYVSQMFALQRFVTACAGRGQYPIKFNGSLFTVPAAGGPGDGDYRLWGPGYWWQNTRLPYISACSNGDFDLLEPLWRMYIDQNLPLNKYRTKKYFGFDDSAYFIECVQFWGDVFQETYGWTPVAERKDPLQASGYHKWEWVAGPELVWMMLDEYEHTGDEKLLRQRIVPTADAVMRFFDNYYKTNAAGQLVMHPSQACETWWDCTNPMPELAGLRAIAARLLALPEAAAPPASRAYWKAFLAKLPPLPTRDTPGGKALAPAEKFADKRNGENPEFYAVFPFRLCSFEKDNRDLGVQALRYMWDGGAFGWRQDGIFMAYLGLAYEAQGNAVYRARHHDAGSRFPAFWGPNFDWIPDQTHGGVMMRTFQSMLLQTEGKKIFLLPAWPKEWHCEFKLHAPQQTIVEGKVIAGKVVDLKVTPESRRKDVIVRQ